MLTKVTGHKDNLLRVKGLLLGSRGSSTALMMKATYKVLDNGTPMLTMLFRTADKKVIVGTKFDVQAGDHLAQVLLEMNRTPVDVEYIVREWNGRYVLNVENVTVNPEADPAEFFESYDDVEEVYSEFNSAMRRLLVDDAYVLTVSAKAQTCSEIGRGTTGATLVVLSRALSILEHHHKHEDFSTLVQVWKVAINPWLLYQKTITKVPIMPRTEQLNLVNTYTKVISDDRVRNIAADVVASVIGLGEPQHYWAHVIKQAIDLSVQQLNMLTDMESAIDGSIAKYGDGTLVKY